MLVNEASASSSELLAAALKDNKRACIIGTQTFGKGLVQEVYSVGNGEVELQISVSKFSGPSGCQIQAVGVIPNIICSNPEMQYRAAVAYLVEQAKESNLDRKFTARKIQIEDCQ